MRIMFNNIFCFSKYTLIHLIKTQKRLILSFKSDIFKQHFQKHYHFEIQFLFFSYNFIFYIRFEIMISIKIYLNNYTLILFERNYISKLRPESSSEQCERFEILFRTILYDNLTKKLL